MRYSTGIKYARNTVMARMKLGRLRCLHCASNCSATSLLGFACYLALCGTAVAQQTFPVLNAATLLSTGAPDCGVAPGSLVSIYIDAIRELVNLPADRKLTLRFESADATASQDLPLDFRYYEAGQTLLAVLPADAPTGPADLTLSTDGGLSFTSRIYIANSNFGVYANTAQQFATPGVPVANLLTNPAQPGQIMTLWGTGLGNADPAQVVVNVADVTVRPDFVGHAPGQPGLDQINFRLPVDAAIPDDCYVPVAVGIAGRIGNTVTIAVDRGGNACRHPLGLSRPQLVVLDRGGSIWTAGTSVESYELPADGNSYYRYDVTQLAFNRYPASAIAAQAGPFQPASQQNACSLGHLHSGSLIGRWFGVGGVQQSFFDAGTVFEQNPSGKTLQLKSAGGGTYLYSFSDSSLRYSLEQLPPSPLLPGLWSIATSGSADLAPWQLNFSTPPPLAWTNRNQLQRVKRGEDLTLAWNPDGYGSSDRAWVSVNIAIPIPGTDEYRYGSVNCEAAASAGTIGVPGNLLSLLPGNGQTASVFLSLEISRARESQMRFSVTSHGETIPGGIDYKFTSIIGLPIE